MEESYDLQPLVFRTLTLTKLRVLSSPDVSLDYPSPPISWRGVYGVLQKTLGVRYLEYDPLMRFRGTKSHYNRQSTLVVLDSTVSPLTEKDKMTKESRTDDFIVWYDYLKD